MTPEPARPDLRREARRDLWALIAIAACCAAILLALVATGLGAGGLTAARPWLVAAAVILGAVAVIVHRTGGSRRC
jgi:hypothetical protein